MSPLEWNTPLSTTYNNSNSNNPNGPTHPGARASVVPHRWDSGFSVNNTHTHTYKAVWNSMRSHSLLLLSPLPLFACVCSLTMEDGGAPGRIMTLVKWLFEHTHTLWQLAWHRLQVNVQHVFLSLPHIKSWITWELRRWRAEPGLQMRLPRKIFDPSADDSGHLLAGLQDECVLESVWADNGPGFGDLALQILTVLHRTPMIFSAEIQD